MAEPTRIQPTDKYNYAQKFGEVITVNLGRVISARAENGKSKSGAAVYEPPAGWVIIDVQPSVKSKINDASYDMRLTAKNSNYASDERVREVAKTARDYSAKGGDKAFAEKEKELDDFLSSSSRKFQSRNDHLELTYSLRSSVRKVLGQVVDKRNASLNVDLTVVIARVPTEEDLRHIERPNRS